MIPALCCICGTVREASRQAFRTPDVVRRLKCATCGSMTVHAGVWGYAGEDWRDQSNAATTREAARGLRS